MANSYFVIIIKGRLSYRDGNKMTYQRNITKIQNFVNKTF